jgi:hypothetical protein
VKKAISWGFVGKKSIGNRYLVKGSVAIRDDVALAATSFANGKKDTIAEV